MKFVVTKPYGNEVDVKLHWESKDKLKRALYWTGGILGTAAFVLHLQTKNNKESK
jgi:hypothetical protein